MEKIICNACGVSKDATTGNFYWRNDSKKYKKKCKVCILDKSKYKYQQNSNVIKAKVAKYREENREQIKEKMKEYNSLPETQSRMKKYRQDNKKLLRKKEKEWRLKNPEKAKVITRRKNQKRMKNPMVRIRINMSRGISLALNRVGSSKAGDSVMNHFEFTIDELKHHLKSQFESWMNWENYGSYTNKWVDDDKSTWKWQIDHIIPHSEFKYDSMDHPNFKECWKLSNLRPLSAKKNCLDGCNRTRHRKI